MTVVTVADVLAMPIVRAADPTLLAGRSALERRVRWAHASELIDIAPLLREGDLLLTTGIAMPDDESELRRFAIGLAESSAAGLVIELGRRWSRLPDALVHGCEEAGLPLIALAREVRFAAVAQAVGERIVDEQLAEWREAQRVHEIFTELGVKEASPGDILDAAQRLAGAAVVLESEQHQVLDYRPGPQDVSGFLNNWSARSRSVDLIGRTHWDPAHGWFLTRIGKRERGWGRLVLQATMPPSIRVVTVADRAAVALALHRLNDRQRDSAIRRSHHELLRALIADPYSEEVVRRCELAGLPINDRQFMGVIMRPHVRAGQSSDGAGAIDSLISATVRAAHQANVPALVCEVDRGVRALLSFPPCTDANHVIDVIAESVQHRVAVVIAAGRPVMHRSRVDWTLREAVHVAESLRGDPRTDTVYRLEDVHLRGLLSMLSDDDRLRLFVVRELEAMREYDNQHDTSLIQTVRALLEHPTSKSAAAASIHVSRPVFYDRLAKVEQLLSASLDDPAVRASLYVALIAEETSISQSRTHETPGL